MATGSGLRSAPARGTLDDVPVAHALIYVRNTRLSGTFEFASPDGRKARIDVWRGVAAAASTTPPVARFGGVAYELGLLDAATLDESAEQAARWEVPHAEYLLQAGILSAEEHRSALLEQVRRRIHYVFTFPASATFAFFDTLPDTKEPAVLVDLLAPTWRGLRDFPPLTRIREVLARLGEAPLTMLSEAPLEHAELSYDERTLCETLLGTPLTLSQLRLASRLPEWRVDLLVYLLVIARCVDPIEPARSSASRTMPSMSRPGTPHSFDLPLVATPNERRLLGPMDLGAEGVRARAARIRLETAEEALGLAEGASAEATRAAYLRLARLWNPSRLPDELEEVRPEVERVFAHLGHAYRFLTEQQARSGS